MAAVAVRLIATKMATNPLSSRVLGILRNLQLYQVRTWYTWYVPGTAVPGTYLVRYLVLVP